MVGKELRFLLVHSSIYGLGTVISQIVSFLLLPLYTRYLTPADYGVLETVSVSQGIIGIVVTIGIARAMSRFYYETEDESGRNRVVSTAYLTYGFLALIAAPVLLIIVSDPLSRLLFGSSEYVRFFRISFLTLIIAALTDIGMMYLRLLKKPVIFISVTLSRLICLIALNLVFVVHYRMGVEGILNSSLYVAGVYGLGMTGAVLRKTGLGFSAALSRQLITYSLPIIPSHFGNTIVKQADKYFVLYLTSVADMGIYSLGLKIGNAVHTLLTVPFNMAYIPRRFEIMKRDDAKEMYSRIFTYYIILVGFVGLSLSVLVPELLHFMVTPKFMKAADIIPLVVLSMIIFGTHYHFDFGILYSKKTKYLSYIGLICAAVQIGLNYLLIGRYGFFGAVWSSIISLALQAFLLYEISRRLYPIQYEFSRIFKYALLAFGFYALSTQVHSTTLMLNLSIKLLMLLLFPVVLILFGIITQAEKARIKEVYAARLKPLLVGKVIPRTP